MIIKDPNADNMTLTEILTQEDLYNEFNRLSGLVDDAIARAYTTAQEWAEANHAYREAKSKAIIQIRGGKNRDEREALAGPLYETEKFASELAQAMKEVNIVNIQARRTQLSALQTMMAARRSEFEATSYNQLGDKHGA